VWPAQRRAESLELAETAVSTGVEPDFAEIRTDLLIAAMLAPFDARTTSLQPGIFIARMSTVSLQISLHSKENRQ
jgi:hypothetical protein